MDADFGFKTQKGKLVINLESLPEGKLYEDCYRGYLDVFERIARLPASISVTVHKAPWSWVPLLRHLRAETDAPVPVFRHCPLVRAAIMDNSSAELDRTALEVLCNFRPETADALWKCDMQWPVPKGRALDYMAEKEFIVTTNGAYHRHEVLDFMDRLRAYKPRKTKALLVPCAADKPYPAPMHRACLSVMPADFYMLNATGVVGLVPQDLWGVMPFYDSGIPNQWRLFEMIRWFFTKNRHDEVVVYCDFYSIAIFAAFTCIGFKWEGDNTLYGPSGAKVKFVLPVKEYDDYVNLMHPSLLQDLAATLSGN